MARTAMTRELVWAAATDAGNRSMHKAARTKWSRADYNAAVREFNRLWPTKNPLPVGRSKTCHIRRLRNGRYQVRL